MSDVALTETLFGYLIEDTDALSAASTTSWWRPRMRIIESWLKDAVTRAEIPADGSEDMIRRHIQRGNIYPHAQLKCWRHILLELQDIPCFATRYADSTRIAAIANASPSRGKIRPGKELIIISDDTRNPERVNDIDEPPSSGRDSERRNGDSAAGSDNSISMIGGTKKFSALTMAERQAEWLRKKQEKILAEKSRQEEEKDKELTFQPKILRRSTMGDRPGNDPTPRMLQRPDTGGSTRGSARKLDVTSDTTKPASAGSSREKTIPRVPTRSAGRHRKKPQPYIPTTQTIGISSDLLESMKTQLTVSMTKSSAPSSAAAGAHSDAKELDDLTEDNTPTSSSASLIDDARGANDASDALTDQGNSWSEYPVIGGRHVDFDSSDTKARLVLQDASRFELSSMYRKTDKKAKRDGVALHVGRREDTFEEEVIAVLFDKEKVSELDATLWWSNHEYRFAHFIRELPKMDYSSYTN